MYLGERDAQNHGRNSNQIFPPNSVQSPVQNSSHILEQQTQSGGISDHPTLAAPSFFDQLRKNKRFSLPFLQLLHGFSRGLPRAVLDALVRPKSRAKMIFKGGSRVKGEKTAADLYTIPNHSGQGLEDATAILLRAEGFKDVYQSVMCLDQFNNYSELDVVATKRCVWTHFYFLFYFLPAHFMKEDIGIFATHFSDPFFFHPFSSFFLLFRSWWRRLSPPRRGSPIRWLQGWVAVECKQYSDAVKFEYVAKTAGVAHLLQIHPADMLFVTTSTYTPRCVAAGLPLVDGVQLREYVWFSISLLFLCFYNHRRLSIPFLPIHFHPSPCSLVLFLLICLFRHISPFPHFRISAFTFFPVRLFTRSF